VSWLPLTSPAFDKTRKPYAYDPEKAKKLLADAGYPNGFEFEWTTSQNESWGLPIVEAVIPMLAKVGIKVKVKQVEVTVLVDLRNKGEFEAFILSSQSGPDALGAIFRREGDFWRIAFEGLSVQLSDQKGFHDLARLLASPDREIHCLELANRPDEGGNADPVLDRRARREIEERVRDLQGEIDHAEALHDTARAARAREELDQIAELVSGALGLNGRSRRLGSAVERARSAVTWRIRSAIKKIATTHPRLGRHLENSLKTGTFCVYQPERRVDWAC